MKHLKDCLKEWWCQTFGHRWGAWTRWFPTSPGLKRRFKICSRCWEQYHEEVDDVRVIRNTPIPVRNTGPMRAWLDDIALRERDDLGDPDDGGEWDW